MNTADSHTLGLQGLPEPVTGRNLVPGCRLVPRQWVELSLSSPAHSPDGIYRLVDVRQEPSGDSSYRIVRDSLSSQDVTVLESHLPWFSLSELQEAFHVLPLRPETPSLRIRSNVSGHTLYLAPLAGNEKPAFIPDAYSTVYIVRNGHPSGQGVMYACMGWKDASTPSETHVFFPNGKMWGAFGRNCQEAIEGAQRDAWLYF